MAAQSTNIRRTIGGISVDIISVVFTSFHNKMYRYRITIQRYFPLARLKLILSSTNVLGLKGRAGELARLTGHHSVPSTSMLTLPIVPIETKICMKGNLVNLITYTKFQDDIFRVIILHGVEFRISHFPVDFCMGLTTVQRYCALCDTYICLFYAVYM